MKQCVVYMSSKVVKSANCKKKNWVNDSARFSLLRLSICTNQNPSLKRLKSLKVLSFFLYKKLLGFGHMPKIVKKLMQTKISQSKKLHFWRILLFSDLALTVASYRSEMLKGLKLNFWISALMLSHTTKYSRSTNSILTCCPYTVHNKPILDIVIRGAYVTILQLLDAHCKNTHIILP